MVSAGVFWMMLSWHTNREGQRDIQKNGISRFAIHSIPLPASLVPLLCVETMFYEPCRIRSKWFFGVIRTLGRETHKCRGVWNISILSAEPAGGRDDRRSIAFKLIAESRQVLPTVALQTK